MSTLLQVMTAGNLPIGMDPDEAQECERRLDTARFVLMRRHKWAKRTLRNLTIRLRPVGTLAVDKWLRLYANPKFVAMCDDEELLGVFWHEAHHILRRHPERLGHLPYTHHINEGADAEINGDLLKQKVKLPQGCVTPASLGLPPDLPAESYVRMLGEGDEQGFEQMQMPEDDGSWEPDDDELDGDVDGHDGSRFNEPDDDYPEDDDGGEGSGEGDGDPTDEDDDADGGGGAGGESDEDGDEDGGEGGAPGGDDGGDESDDQGEAGGDGDGGAGEQDGPPKMTCGSGSGAWDGLDEDPEPDDQEQARLNRELRKQDIDTVEAYEEDITSASGYSEVGHEMYEQAKERLGRSDYDWRETIGAEIRTAMEMASDDAEDYTFRKRSRRQGNSTEVILPAAFRPVPELWVIVDASGSMDVPKTQMAMREFQGIMERLAIPRFRGLAWDTELMEERWVQTQEDLDALTKHGGGTDMVAAINHATSNGAEVVVVLTDTDCHWDGIERPEVPLIIGVIKQSGARALPNWARIVPVEEAK